jgi:transposase
MARMLSTTSANPNFILMEDGASCHTANYTSHEREKHGIPNTDWPPGSPDFNPIECIWTILKCRIKWRRASEHVTTVVQMQVVLQEEWEKITVKEINKEIVQLPKIMQCCLSVNGSNNYHA